MARGEIDQGLGLLDPFGRLFIDTLKNKRLL